MTYVFLYSRFRHDAVKHDPPQRQAIIIHPSTTEIVSCGGSVAYLAVAFGLSREVESQGRRSFAELAQSQPCGLSYL
jgi:hypothetical protein